MLFNEARFFVFFAVVLCVYWTMRSNRLRKLWLLGASYAFYAGWDWRFLSLLLVSTGVDYCVGLGLGKTSSPVGRKWLLAASVVAQLTLLGFFKYYNFFVGSAAAFLRWLGLPVGDVTLQIVLPVGISFYTFETLSYTIDVYRRVLPPTKNLLDFALFIAFFPKLVAGPILRARDFLPQLEKKRAWVHDVPLRASLMLFLWGFIKKACLADQVSPIVDEVFSDPAAYSTFSTWMAMGLYHIQVYCDFSGYSDMAIATAGLLGLRLTENFAFPYFAASIGEFWRRWHISLGSWLKDYLYFPLGGGRVSWLKRFRNVYVTIVLCGLWHGAAWNFVFFGFLHATYVFVDQRWKASELRKGLLGRVSAAISLPLTTLLLFLGWPIFRSESYAGTLQLFRTMLFVDPGGSTNLSVAWAWLFIGAAVVHWAFYKRLFDMRFAAAPNWAFSVAYGGVWALVLPWVAIGYKPFIYFQF